MTDVSGSHFFLQLYIFFKILVAFEKNGLENKCLSFMIRFLSMVK